MSLFAIGSHRGKRLGWTTRTMMTRKSSGVRYSKFQLGQLHGTEHRMDLTQEFGKEATKRQALAVDSARRHGIVWPKSDGKEKRILQEWPSLTTRLQSMLRKEAWVNSNRGSIEKSISAKNGRRRGRCETHQRTGAMISVQNRIGIKTVARPNAPSLRRDHLHLCPIEAGTRHPGIRR